MAFVGEAGFDLAGHVDRLVLGEFVDIHVIDQLLNLLWRHRFVEESGDFLDFTGQILRAIESNYTYHSFVKTAYLLHVFVEKK